MGTARYLTFIFCIIIVLYLIIINQILTPSAKFSDLLTLQSPEHSEKKNVRVDVVNLTKLILSDSDSPILKHQQYSVENQSKPLTSHEENNLPDKTNDLETDKDMTATELARELKRKVEAFPVEQLTEEIKTCGPEEVRVFGCGSASKCKYRTKLPESYESRINQLVQNQRLQIQPDHLKTLQSMSAQFKKRPKFLIVTGASSNHYLESQAMLYHVHKLIPNDIKYEIIFYDLGLSDEERSAMKEFCNCTVIVFPFSAFPEHVRELHCYGWKAPIVYAHSHQAEIIMWSDASIRFKSVEDLQLLLQWTKERGLLQSPGGRAVAKHTSVKMFHYFGDEPCAYASYKMRQSGAGFYHNEPLIRQAVLAPWVSCSLKKDCICPKDMANIHRCSGLGPRWERPYSSCHRFDQSAINIILAKLFQRAENHVTINRHRCYDIKRGDKAHYFDYLNKTRLGLPTEPMGTTG